MHSLSAARIVSGERASTLATVLVALSIASCGAAHRPLTGPALAREAIDGDVAVLLETLETAYGPHALRTPETWSSMRGELEGLSRTEPMDRQRLCERIARALTRLIDPRLRVTLTADGERCIDPDGGTSGGFPRPGSRIGENVARDATQLYEATRRGDVLILGVRRFEPETDPGWTGLDAVPLDAPGLLLDLRGASGSDPRGLFPVLAALLPTGEIPPILRGVARAEGDDVDLLRDAAVANGELPRRDAVLWQSFVGEGGPPALPANAPPTRPISVLVDRGCEEACQLIARVLETWVGAAIGGELSTETPMITDEPALRVLPASGLFIHFDTTAYLIAEPIERYVGLSLLWRTGGSEWTDGCGSAREHGPRTGALVESTDGSGACSRAVDLFEPSVTALEQQVAVRQQIVRFTATPPAPCASLPSVDREEALSPAARARLSGFYLPGERQTFAAEVALEAEAAASWVSGCPDVTVDSAFRVGRDGPALVLFRVRSFEAASRMLESEAVLRLRIELDVPPHIVDQPMD